MTVRNTGETPTSFCRYHTPFETIKANIFTLIRPGAGQALPYQGEKAERTPPGPQDDVRLAAGESTQVTFDLRDAYGALSPEPYGYQLKFRGSDLSKLPDSAVAQVVVSAD